MSVENRLAIQQLCNEIGRLVADQEVDFCFPIGRVRISILTGERAKLEADFMKAVGKYLMATRFPNPSTDVSAAREELMRAFDYYLANVKL